MRQLLEADRRPSNRAAGPTAKLHDDQQATALLGAAVAAGRLPGEPAKILRPGSRRPFLSLLFGTPTRSPLADPRLEVVRAISASLARGLSPVRRDLVAAAYQVGLTQDELGRAFPDVDFRLAHP